MEFSISEDTLDTFQSFLEAVSVDRVFELHIVFQRGTVVRVSSADVTAASYEGSPFTEAYVREWPIETLANAEEDFEPIILSNVAKYTAACDFFTKAPIRAAYSLLFRTGYLEPGPQSDRAATGIGDGTYIVKYPNTGTPEDNLREKVFSLVLPQLDTTINTDNAAEAAANAAVTVAADYRRLDWMFPKIKTIIGKLDSSILADLSAQATRTSQ